MPGIRDGQTESIRDSFSRAENFDDMKDLLNKYSPYYTDWKRYINNLLDNFYGCNVSRLAADCGFSRNTVRKWRDNGDMPRSRKEFIKLGFGVGMDTDDINDLLQRYGKYPKLYAKSLEDAIYIYSLTHHKSFSEAEELADKLLTYFERDASSQESAEPLDLENTTRFQTRIKKLNTDEDLLGFIDEYRTVFDNVYSRLTNYIDTYVDERTRNYADTGEKFSLNSLLNDKIANPIVVGYFNDMVSALRTRKTIPNRLRLVALGVHLEMTIDELDKLLELANMEKLCPKDRVECAVIYAVESLMLSDYDDLVGGLYERLDADRDTKERCMQIIDKYRRLEEEQDDCSRNDIAAYLSQTLQALDIEEANELIELLS